MINVNNYNKEFEVVDKLPRYIPQEVKDFLEEVEKRTEGYNVYLGGGFLRDLYVALLYGNTFTPKDIDLFFIGTYGEDNGTRFKQHLPALPKTYINFNLNKEDLPQDSVDRGISTIQGVFVPSLNITKDVQLIVYNDNCLLSIEELAEDMDCNCNQIMYHHKTRELFATEYFLSSHINKKIKLIKQFDEDRMKERLIHMQKRLPNYNIETHLIIDAEDYKAYEKKPERGGSLT